MMCHAFTILRMHLTQRPRAKSGLSERYRVFAVVDVEGNGQNPPEIIEIAVLRVDG